MKGIRFKKRKGYCKYNAKGCMVPGEAGEKAEARS